MAHRARHRHLALLQRVTQGRTIATDLNEDGSNNAAYKAAKRDVAAMRAAGKGRIKHDKQYGWVVRDGRTVQSTHRTELAALRSL